VESKCCKENEKERVSWSFIDISWRWTMRRDVKEDQGGQTCMVVEEEEEEVEEEEEEEDDDDDEEEEEESHFNTASFVASITTGGATPASAA
jgi:hypothetical protein